ncbi:hypothetical protein DOE76_02555, partial [Leifsonia sp. ku-ls]
TEPAPASASDVPAPAAASAAPADPAPAAPAPAATSDPAPSSRSAAPEATALAAGDPVLTVTGVVVNAGGGTATPSSWTYTLTGKRNNGGNVSPAIGYTLQSGVVQTVTPTETSGNAAGVLRSYTLTESGGPANYTLSGIACTGASDNGTFAAGALTGLQLHAGDTASCTVTNTYQAPPTASIVVRAGGQRTGTSSVGALPDGAVYQAVPVGGGAPATCAIVSGQCTIAVPAGSAYTVSAQTAASGYYLNPTLDVGGSSSGSPTAYGFRTGTLAANSTTTVPGTDVSSVYTDASGNRFSGMLAQSLQNPAVQQRCGLRIGLVLDQSGSMSGSKQTALKAAANDVVTSLTGTPSTLAVYTFSDAVGPSVGATSTASAAAAQPLHSFIDGLATPAGSTNWDRGLGQVGAGFDLVILLTDGNPTTYGAGTVDGSNARIAYVEQGMFSANRIKGALGARLVAVGIGVDGGAENLRAVSGPVADSDYFAASDTGFGATLQQLAAGSCSNTVTVQKRIETAAGSIVDNAAAANGWSFAGTVSSGTIDAFAPTATQNGSTGFTSATVGIPAGTTPTVSLTETAQPGYALDRAASSCRVDGQPVAIGGAGTTISFTGAAGVSMSCVFVNRIVQTYGSFSVTKHVTGDGAPAAAGKTFTVHYSYPAGAGFAAGSGDLTLTDGATATSPALPTGAVVALTEATPPGVAGATWGAPAFAPSPTLTIAADTTAAVTLTNPIALDRAAFTVEKRVDGDGAGAVPAGTAFTVNWSYPAKAGVYPAASGTVTVAAGGGASAPVAVPAGAVVTLGEATPAPIAGIHWGAAGVFSPGSPVTVGTKGTTTAVTVTNTATLATGRFSVEKRVTGDAALVPPSTPFTVHYSYPAGTGFTAGQGEVTVTPGGGAVTSGPLPQGAVVHLTEPDRPAIPDGSWGEPSFSANDIVIGDGTVTAVVLTNPITHDTGSFDVRKAVAGDAAGLVGADASFRIHYQWDAADDGSFPAGDGVLTVRNDGVVVAGPPVPVGASVVLGELPAAPVAGASLSDVAFSPDSPLRITDKDTTLHVVVTNTYTLNRGTFSVTKKVTGAAGLVPGDTPFTVDYSYPAGSGYPSGSGHLTVTPDGGAVRSGPIPQGAVVHLSEAARPAIPNGTWGDPVFSANDIVIGDGDDVAVTLTNPIRHDTGTISVVKSVVADGAGAVPADAAFPVTYHWDADPDGGYPAGDGTITLHNDGVAVAVPDVPVGAAVALTEGAHASFPGVTWRSASFSPAGPVTVTESGATVAVTLTNVSSLDTGGFTVVKRVTGDGASLLPSGTVFTVHYAYTGGIAGQAGTGTLGLIDGVPQSVTGLPAGAVVTFQEDAPAAVPGGRWGDPAFDPGQLTIGAGDDLRVTLDNPLAEIPPTLQLKKVVTDGVLPPTDWVLTGTGEGSPTVTDVDGGDTDAVAVRTGVAYRLSEAPKDGAAGTDEFAAGDWACADASGGTLTLDRTGAGSATLHGLAAGQTVVCTLTNTHRDQGVRLQKTLAGPATQNPDGTWTVRYALAVANRSTLAATSYDLDDTLRFGAGIAVQEATWTGPSSGAFSGATAALARGAALAAGATASYIVTVVAAVGADAWREGTTDCPSGEGSGGFLNTATVTSAGASGSSSACDSPGVLTVRKTAGEVAQGQDGHLTIGYDIVVTNATPKPQLYDLLDTPQPAPGAAVVSATATKNGDPIAYDGGRLAAGAAIGGGSPEHPVTDRYTVVLEVDVAALDTAQAACDGAGTGLFNAATLTTGTVARESDACADVPTGTLTLVKTVAPGFGGDRSSADWTLTAIGGSGRTISGRYTAGNPDPAITAVRVPSGTYALSEGPDIPGYALTVLVCTDQDDRPVTVAGGAIELTAGTDVTCTFTNTPRPAHLTLIKEVADSDGSGTAKTPHDWTLTATPAFGGFGPVSGRGDPGRADGVAAVPVWAGRYDLSESGPSGFAAGQWSCEGASVDGSAVTIPLGADVTCRITNTATLPRLTLVKVVDNGETGGRGVPSDWVLSAHGPTTFSGPGSDDPAAPDPAITRIGVAVGDYTLAEDATAAPAGYELAGLTCTNTVDGTVLDTSAADPTLHLAEGDDVVCTFTNRAIPAAWTLSKSSDRGAAVMPGDVIRYVLTLTHTGGVLPRSLSLGDVDDLSGLTPHASFVPGSLSASAGAATLEGGRLDWTITDPAGPSFTLAYRFRVAPDAWGVTLRNALTPPRDVACAVDACETTSSTPDLQLTKTARVTAKADPADPTRVLPGGTVAYTLSAHNPTAVDLPAGQTERDDVSGLIAHATLGDLGTGLRLDGPDRIVWTLPAVPAGATVTVGYSATVAGDAAGSTLTNTLRPDTGHCVSPGEDGTGCTTVNDVPRIDFGIAKTASTEGPVDDDPGASSAYDYTLTVTNHGDTTATDAVVTDVLPAQLTLDVAKGSGGFDDVTAGWAPSYDAAGAVVTVRIPALAAGASGSVRLHVLVRPVVHGSVDAPVEAVPPGEDGPAPVTPPATIDNRACVAVADDVDPSNDCSTASVPQRAVAANIWVQCQADVPYLHYAIRTTPNLSGEPVTLQWTPSRPGENGVPAGDLPPDPAGVTRTLHDGDDGAILWPGAAVDAKGVGVGFPGWRPIRASDYDAGGTLRFPPEQVFEGLVYDPSTVASDAWRHPSVVTIRVNPTETYTVVYPPAATACAAARVASLGIVKTASTSLTHPGGSFTYTLQVNDLGLGAAEQVTLSDPIPADLRVDAITTDSTAFPRWQDCAVAGADGDGYGGTLTCTLFGPLSASAPSAPDVTVGVTVRTGTTAQSISNTASVCSRHQGDAAAVTACADATAVVYLSLTALLAATGLDLYAAGGVALVLLASGALLWTVLLRRRRRYADIAV